MLDEVDILFNDEDFEVALNSLMNSSPVATQYLFVTATLPVDVYNKLIEVFPDCEVVMGPGMHRTSIRLEEVGFQFLNPFHGTESFHKKESGNEDKKKKKKINVMCYLFHKY